MKVEGDSKTRILDGKKTGPIKKEQRWLLGGHAKERGKNAKTKMVCQTGKLTTKGKGVEGGQGRRVAPKSKGELVRDNAKGA